mgnify:CR=1 FL=1
MYVCIISSEHLRRCRIISCSEKLTKASSTISVKQCHITGTIIQASLGMTGLAPSRLSTYLANRTQIVQGGSSSSCVTFLSFGVPQGSVLGPLLVAIYTSPIARIAAPYNVFSLHWLYVEYKLAVVTFKARTGTAPQYLCSLVNNYEPARNTAPQTCNYSRFCALSPCSLLTASALPLQ